MKEIEKALMGMIAVLAVALVSIKRRLPVARRFSSGTTTLALAGIVLLVAAGTVSADCVGANYRFSCDPTTGLSNVVNESCTFDGDMNCPAGHGLIVDADGITINGSSNCYALNGSSTTCAACWDEVAPEDCDCGILSTGGHDNVVIKNLEVKNFCNGIVTKGVNPGNGANNNIIECCEVHHNGVDASGMTNGIYVLYQAHDNVITKCDVYNNTGKQFDPDPGCDLGGHGIKIYNDAHDNRITCNNISSNEGAGIYSKRGCLRGLIEYNEIWNNGINVTLGTGLGFQGSGIRLECMNTNYWNVTHNNIHDNIGPGIFNRGQHNTFRYNNVTNSTNGTQYADQPCDVATMRGCGIIFHGDGGPSYLYNNTFCNNEAPEDVYVCAGHPVTYDDNTCGDVVGGFTCEWNCDNLVSVYYDYDQDGKYSAATCPCSPQCVCDFGSCCNPGKFNATHADMLNDSGICWLVEGTDTNDCCYQGDEPDLVITDVTLSGTHPVSVTYTVENQGINAASASTTLITTSYGSEFRIDSVPALGGSASHTGTVDGLTCPCDTALDVKVTADICGAVDESNENNNVRNAQQTCLACPVAIDVDINTSRALAENGQVNISWNPSGGVPNIYVYDGPPSEGGILLHTEEMKHTDPSWWIDGPGADGSDPYMVNDYAGQELIDHLYDQVENQTRFYSIMPRPTGPLPDPPDPQVGKCDAHLAAGDAWISLPHQVSVTDIDEVLKYSHWPGVRLQGGGYNTADKVYAVSEDGGATSSARLRTTGTWQGSVDLQSDRAFHVDTDNALPAAPDANVTLRLFL